VRRNINFFSTIMLITHVPAIKVVRIYTKTILLNSKTSEVNGHKISGTKKRRMQKSQKIIFFTELLYQKIT
jgi:hypothetical protein